MSLREEYLRQGIEITESQEKKILELNRDLYAAGIPGLAYELLDMLVYLKRNSESAKSLATLVEES